MSDNVRIRRQTAMPERARLVSACAANGGKQVESRIQGFLRVQILAGMVALLATMAGATTAFTVTYRRWRPRP